MAGVCKISKLFIYLSVLVASSQSHPAYDTNGNAVPALAHQAELNADLVQHSQSDSDLKIGLLTPAEKTRESAKLETEAVPSKVLSFYDNSQKMFADKTQPLVLLDTISEHEKYGNDGGMFDGISRGLVNGYEAFSNLLNSLITRPKEIARTISKGITAQLDVIGGKLVGLR